MSVVINTNYAATLASNNLAASNQMLQRSLNRLSSGSKIVNPADDAGGLAVSMKLSATAKRQGAAASNIANGVSFLQTQDGALQVAGKVLSRISELKTLYSDPTKNSDDLANYQAEFAQLQAQLNSLNDEKFNGISLFGSSALSVLTTEDGNESVSIEGVELLGAPAFPTFSESFANLSAWTDTSLSPTAAPSVSGGELSLIGDAGPPQASVTTNATYTGPLEINLQVKQGLMFSVEFGGTTVANLSSHVSDSNWHDLRITIDDAGNASAYLDGSSTAFSTTSGVSTSAQSIKLMEATFIGSNVRDFSVASTSSSGEVGSITSAADLNALSLSSVTGAIQDVATFRATNGAQQSRLGFAAEVLTVNKANIEAANSRITDVDVAQESTQMARYNILVQAGTAMLSQANQSAQTALRLIG